MEKAEWNEVLNENDLHLIEDLKPIMESYYIYKFEKINDKDYRISLCRK